jgi:capsid protein
MKILGFQIGKAPEMVKPQTDQEAFFNNTNFVANDVFTWSYDGEKNLGEIGPVKDYIIDYDVVRARSWQSYLESDISQTVLNKYTTWVIGAGLKLQSEPNLEALLTEKITLNEAEFVAAIEPRWRVYANSKVPDVASECTLHKIAKRAFKHAIIGGDVLVVLSYKKNQLKIRLIDGAKVKQPMVQSNWTVAAKTKGNTIRNGVEIDADGKHVAYYVVKANTLIEYERIEAYGKGSGKRMAYMVYGNEYRLNSRRGLPLIATVLETLAKLERYKEATVGSAEERQKIAYFIEHGISSTGETPLTSQLAKAMNADAETDLPMDRNGKELANTVAASTNKQTFNMPIDSTLKMLESKNELYFKDFYSVNIDLVCAAIGIPPEVAMSKYDSNFSASRAALKDWEHTLNVVRKDFSDQFYTPIYELFLEIEILKNKVQAPGYLGALVDNNYTVLSAYRQARFIGQSVPHIDPLKEVKAEREKLGSLSSAMPLTTVEQATETLNTGDSVSNFNRFSKEMKMAQELDIVNPEPQAVESSDGDVEDN